MLGFGVVGDSDVGESVVGLKLVGFIVDGASDVGDSLVGLHVVGVRDTHPA